MSVVNKIKTVISNVKNFGGTRATSKIKYIVIHYTANDGDTDEANGRYFKNNVVKASAHYFVDSDSITQSVKDDRVAWAVGGKKYSTCSSTGGGKYYGTVTNTNSISIELCDDVKNGVIYPSAKTIQNALELTEHLMKKYNIPKSNVIRHFDVTGKPCPKYWLSDAKWKSEFWNKIGGSCGETKPAATTSFMVKINTDVLNVRKGGSTSYAVTAVVKRNEIYTIVEESNGWGKLKSGVGWINLKYTIKL